MVKAINKRCSKDLQAAAEGYCKIWVKINFELVEMTRNRIDRGMFFDDVGSGKDSFQL